MSAEKVWALGFGLFFLVMTRVAYRCRRSFARQTASLMYFYLDPYRREQKIEQTEAMFRIMLGYFFPVFMTLWLLAVIIS